MFLYELHCHTAEGSRCASLYGADIAEQYKSKGYHGIVVTDHFYGGNTAIERGLPWNEWVTGFLQGYRNTKEAGDRIGLQVFLGWEYHDKGTELLTYGLEAEWLYRNSTLRNMSLEDYCLLVRKDGGFLVHAHPFRVRDHRKTIRLLPGFTDGVETVNKCNEPKENYLADQYAQNFGLMKLGGTDFHHSGHLERLGGVAMPYEIKSINDIFDAAQAEKLRIL